MESSSLYEFLTRTDSDSFLYNFDQKWSEFLGNCNFEYKNATQLNIGNRLRPKLVCWGYAIANDNNIQQYNFDLIYKASISIELVHKASIILDDLIDQDDARHGKETFHKQYSQNEAILFANYLVNQALNNLYSNMRFKDSIIQLFITTVDDLVSGALKEINSLITGKKAIIEIIRLETISLLTSSLLIGAYLNDSCYSERISLLKQIGYNCGLLFQILNDLEPFTNTKKNAFHKGKINFDYGNNRKNIVIPYIFEQISENEKLESNLKILDIFNNKNILQLIKADLDAIKLNIFSDMDKLIAITSNKQTARDFSNFVDTLIKMCYSRL